MVERAGVVTGEGNFEVPIVGTVVVTGSFGVVTAGIVAVLDVVVLSGEEGELVREVAVAEDVEDTFEDVVGSALLKLQLQSTLVNRLIARRSESLCFIIRPQS